MAIFFIYAKNRPTVAIIQTLPYFSNQQQPVALILQIVRERFILINTSRNTAKKPYLLPPKSALSSEKTDNDIAVSRQEVQALDAHQNHESNQTYSFYICLRLFFYHSQILTECINQSDFLVILLNHHH